MSRLLGKDYLSRDEKTAMGAGDGPPPLDLKPRAEEYSEYIRSPEWDALRKVVLYRAKYRCEECGRENSLQVHHKTYVRFGCEVVEDLEALCRECHRVRHGGKPRSRHKNGNGRDPLSRDERAALGGEAGFAELQTHIRCQDCRDNELSPPSISDPDHPRGRKMGPRRAFDCDTCGGWGKVEAHGKDKLDPYMIPKRG